jgi:hypothetical protein
MSLAASARKPRTRAEHKTKTKLSWVEGTPLSGRGCPKCLVVEGSFSLKVNTTWSLAPKVWHPADLISGQYLRIGH